MVVCHCSTCGPQGMEVTSDENQKHQRNDLANLAREGQSIIGVLFLLHNFTRLK
ncbi:hypothetical protein PAXRUDRAFT_158378 [Paxillus rubicundulus Ve08.2h10]|uniref:Uncharacterized protein n=1 Tax=Paxillus rubicundulus Ve08.2h10 TaxID=930991 RepID=A0A0D0CCR7_9AGAM|nr:hypothetical protein PAXRUDRAFT_158378 [Paxillus rubicundulus Ve08.2h10]